MDDILTVRRKRVSSAFFSLVSGCVLFLSHTAVLATVIEIEPDDFAIGVDLTSVSTFVEVTGFNGARVYVEAARTSSGAPTGKLTFGAHGYSGELSSMQFDSSCPNGFGLSAAKNGVCHWGLGFFFNQPVEWVSLLVLNSVYPSPLPAWWSVHDSEGATLDWGQSLGELEDNRGIPFEMQFQSQEISLIMIGGATGIPMEFDRLRFKVPEPSIVSLVFSGFFCVLLLRRSRSIKNERR
jgi:hypothetical protein